MLAEERSFPIEIPRASMSSVFVSGKNVAIIVLVKSDTKPAPIKIGAGLLAQKKFSPVLEENNVKKSEIEIFRYMTMIIYVK